MTPEKQNDFLTEEDELVFMHEIQQIYFESKGIAKKYTPKKYKLHLDED